MPLSKDHKQRSKQRILDSAVALFSKYGFNKVSINEIMEHAQLTRGGFYAHFGSKEELYAEAVIKASQNSKIFEANETLACDREFIQALINGYLNKNHISQKSPPCPLAFLATDVANEEKQVREVYTKIFKGFVNMMNARAINKTTTKTENQMMALAAMMIGGVAVGRVLTDNKLVDELLESCRNIAIGLIEQEG